MENEAINLFIAKHISNYGENVNFSSNTLEHILSENFSAPARMRRPIALYLHKDDHPFSKAFCSIFNDGDVKTFLEDAYDVIGWDITLDKYESELQAVVNKCLKLRLANFCITDKNACLIILHPLDKETVDVYRTFLDGNVKNTEIVQALHQGKEAFTQRISKLRRENAQNQSRNVLIEEPDAPRVGAIFNEKTNNLDIELKKYSSEVKNIPEIKTELTSDLLPRDKDVVRGKTSNFKKENAATETDAIDFFLAKLVSRYGENINFSQDTLEEVLLLNFSAPAVMRKPIALYLHNEHDTFSEVFCSIFIDEKVKLYLAEVYDMIAWDMSLDEWQHALLAVVNECLKNRQVNICITHKQASLFILHPVSVDRVDVYRPFVSSNVSTAEIISSLKQSKSIFSEKIANLGKENSSIVSKNVSVEKLGASSVAEVSNSEKCSLFGAKEFQQMMCDLLGDREYDSFEYNEHEYLKNKIGYSKFGQPVQETGYDDMQKKEIEKTYLKIVEQNNKFAKWENQVIISFIYNCLEPLEEDKIERKKKYQDYDAASDITPIPVYIIKKCYGSKNPCRIFIDSHDRVYQSWEDYIKNNKLHQCTMVLPKDGRYDCDARGNVILETHFSPACSMGEKVLRTADTASTLAGVSSALIFGASLIPAVAVAPIALTAAAGAGVTAGAYSVARSIMNIYDKAVHEEDLSFLNSEARGAYLNILAGSLGFVGAGATGALTYCASNGIKIGQGTRLVVDSISLANIGISATSLGNSTYQVLNDWINEDRRPSLLTIVQLSSSVLFFGNAVYNFRTAGTIIEEAQTNRLRNYSDSLRSNRHRKMLNKMTKETIRQHGGDTSSGRAEVISTLKNIQNKDETFAILTRNNKLFNKHGIKFSSDGGQIKLNGISVDLSEFGTMSKTLRTEILIDIPAKPILTSTEVAKHTKTTLNIFQDISARLSTRDMLTYKEFLMSNNGIQIVATLLNNFSARTQKQLMSITMDLLKCLNSQNVKFDQYFGDLGTNKFVIILQTIIGYFKYELNKTEGIYREAKKKDQQKPNFNEYKFNESWGFRGTLPDDAKRAMVWFEKAVDTFMRRSRYDKHLLEELYLYFMNELSTNILEWIDSEEKNKNRTKNTKIREFYLKCNICKGYFHTLTITVENKKKL